ncbi:hypothetical protein [Magnetospirillum sulfuroxidans]|uniref:hypothetical protein n=1 Tax=Magnetospirillum sulfuroxidans TaxID=611300 RepID=UPI00201236A9|nr:hypothetical protein [Magnetospirillum sulfuroxidans]
MALNLKEKEALKFLGTHLFYGLSAGATFGSMVLATNMGNIWTLATQSSHPITVLVLFFFGLFVTFGSVGMGVGIMSLARDDDDQSPWGRN